MHGSLLACETCHGCGEITPDRGARISSSACYPLRDESVPRNAVSHEDWVACMDALSTAKCAATRSAIARQLGWSFQSCLSHLPYFDMVHCFVDDVYHHLALGLVRSCAALTFGTTDFFANNTSHQQQHPYSPLELPQQLVDEIGRRVASLSPQLPSEWAISLKNPADNWMYYSGTCI